MVTVTTIDDESDEPSDLGAPEVEEATVSNVSPRASDSVDIRTVPETPLDKTRKRLAFGLLGLFALAMAMYFAGIISHRATVEDMNPLLLSVGPLVGAALGFYFGDRR